MHRLATYLSARFSPIQFIPLALCFGFAVAVVAPALLGLGGKAGFIVSLALFLFLLRLRLFDDIKDHSHDRVHHPERPAAQGVVTQKELAIAAACVFAAEFMIALQGGLLTLVAFLCMSMYAGLLFAEAMYWDAMRRNFTSYIFIHELLLVPLFAYLFLLAGVPSEKLLSAPIAGLFLLLAANFFLLEVARKTRAPENEGTGNDSYTAQYGIAGAAFLLCATILASLLGWVSISLHFAWDIISASPVLVALLAFGVTVAFFSRRPNAARAKYLFLASCLYVAITLCLPLLLI
jgi:4-hydroxybenzoate polyprenyltransferase